MNEILQSAIDMQITKHGGLRAAARVLQCDPAYLSKLRNGRKNNPGASLLKKLKLRRVVTITYLWTRTYHE